MATLQIAADTLPLQSHRARSETSNPRELIVVNTILHLYILHIGPLRRRIRNIICCTHIVISPSMSIMQLNCQQFAFMLQFAEILTFVGELGHPVQISQRRWPVLLFIINQQVHLRLRQELGHSPSAPTGSFFGRRRQLLAVLVFVLHDGREDGCRSSEASLHGVVHSVEPGPGARVCLHASSGKLQLLVETESSADRPQRDLILLSTLPPAPTPVIQNSQEPRCSSLHVEGSQSSRNSKCCIVGNCQVQLPTIQRLEHFFNFKFNLCIKQMSADSCQVRRGWTSGPMQERLPDQTLNISGFFFTTLSSRIHQTFVLNTEHVTSAAWGLYWNKGS